MKKKLLPYILGCSMAVAMTSLVAKADTLYHIGTDIDNGTSTTVTDKSSTIIDNGDTNPQYTEFLDDATGDDSHNEFTEYNDPSTTNTVAKTFGTNSTATGSVVWTAGALGNTRTTTNDIQTEYPVIAKNETQDYRISDTPTTLTEDLESATFNAQDNDTLNTPASTGVTDLETSIPEYDMTIPARTVLPIGATHWRLGNVEINGKYFVRPDKVDVTLSHVDLRHSTYDPGASASDKAERTVEFKVSDTASDTYASTTIDDLDRYFFQNGGTSKQAVFPYAYTAYTSQDYQDGKVSDIKETHQVWLNSALAQWQGKKAGKYSGSITFNAAVVTTDNEDMYASPYSPEA